MNEQKRLYRSRHNRMIAGVLGGLGQYLGVDPTVVRLVYVLLSLFLGVFFGGVLLYLVLWLIIPEEPEVG